MAELFGEQGKGGLVIRGSSKGIDAKSFVSCDLVDFNKTTCFLVDFSSVNQERFSVLPCFGEKTYLFAYGHDISTSRSTVTVLVFAGSSNCSPGDATAEVSNMLDKYSSNRLSASGDSVSMCICGTSGFSNGYLISAQVKSYMPEFNAVTVTFTLANKDPV